MIFAKLNFDGRLTDIRYGAQQPGGVWSDGSQDVPLDAMPHNSGPWTYDAATRRAVPVDPGVVAAEDDARHPERTDLRQQAAAADAAIGDYLAIADNATAAQVRNQVKLLTQATRRVIRRLVQID